ncbi:PepSY-associated TM helix domain-containing protein [Sinimarinibacterium thermocellulolyticum]|uniref:PepSY domain-containing protein n=1 Tax=Sinimarinibacterium thermocellulolyticum TaxID=3170016 RepID=A0ABV2A7H2_9GAMM
MRARTLRRWQAVHTVSSLLCTLFMLMLCITGLPLIFHDEIEDALNPPTWQPAHPDGPHLSLDAVLAIALERRPGEVPIFMSFDVDRPVVNVTSGPTADAPAGAMHFASFDLTSGERVPPAAVGETLMHVLLQLHTDLFLGLPGMLLLAAMGLMFVVAVVSGVVLYGPFMRRLDFGTLRRGAAPRLWWLDLHNLLGVTTVAWALLVAVTGAINALEPVIIEAWRTRELGDLIAEHGGRERAHPRASFDAAVAQAVAAAPDRQLQFVAFPGSRFSTPGHYAIFLHGKTPFTEHLITPVLVDAASGVVVGLREMPAYVKALSLSRPLHFGDYGGLGLKILWALLDLVTIAVLVSGLWLWLRRRRSGRVGYAAAWSSMQAP